MLAVPSGPCTRFAVQGKADVATQYFYTNIEGSDDSATVFLFTPKDSSKKDDAAAVSSP
jgi:hypothetical protein